MALTQVNAANMVTGVLPAANGGTGQATALIPSGTVMMFGQTAAPTGFTKLTANDNAALRVVSGSASTGGSVNFTTAFASQAVAGTVGTSGSTTATNQNTTAGGSVGTSGSTTATNNSYTPAGTVGTSGATTLSESQMPSHQHQGIAYCGASGCGALQWRSSTTNILDTLNQYLDNTNFVGGSGSHTHSGGSFSGTPATITQVGHTHTGGTFTGAAHTHTQDAHTHTGGTFTGTAINLAVKYVDVIMATKD